MLRVTSFRRLLPSAKSDKLTSASSSSLHSRATDSTTLSLATASTSMAKATKHSTLTRPYVRFLTHSLLRPRRHSPWMLSLQATPTSQHSARYSSLPTNRYISTRLPLRHSTRLAARALMVNSPRTLTLNTVP